MSADGTTWTTLGGIDTNTTSSAWAAPVRVVIGAGSEAGATGSVVFDDVNLPSTGTAPFCTSANLTDDFSTTATQTWWVEAEGTCVPVVSGGALHLECHDGPGEIVIASRQIYDVRERAIAFDTESSTGEGFLVEIPSDGATFDLTVGFLGSGDGYVRFRERDGQLVCETSLAATLHCDVDTSVARPDTVRLRFAGASVYFESFDGSMWAQLGTTTTPFDYQRAFVALVLETPGSGYVDAHVDAIFPSP